jgi:hypothetical protein
MSGSVTGWLRGMVLGLGAGLACAGVALACVGDCNGDGAVSVAELIEGVRIALGDAPLSECPAFDGSGDGELRIAELVSAVGAALAGCPPTPPPSDTATPAPSFTPTPTASPTDTPTPTPTVPTVAGRWREDPLAVTASTCPTLITQQFSADLASRPPCEQQVEALSETAVALIDCTGTRVDGTLDRDGTIRFTYPETSATTEGCTVDLTVSVVIPAATSPTVAAYTFAVAFSGTCALDDCAIDAQGAWTRE